MSHKRISFTTFNLRNLNEPKERMYEIKKFWSDEQYADKIKFTAQAMNEMKADVFGFQELWNAKSLNEVLKAANLDSDYTPLVPENLKRKIVCAGAVRSDILVGNPSWIKDFPETFKLISEGENGQDDPINVNITSFRRPVLHFRVKPKHLAHEIHVYVCHFKSKRKTDIKHESWYKKNYHKHRIAIGYALSTIRRTAEAAALRIILTEKMKGNAVPVVVLGDCNDGQHSNTLNILTEQPKFLRADKEVEADTCLYATQTLQQYQSQRDVYYTYIYKNTRESLDHILVSQEFYSNSSKSIWKFEGLDIANDHLNSHKHSALGTTDHGIVRARFCYKSEEC